MQAAIYARISHDPRGESLGVTRQLEDCNELAAAAGWTVADTYIDNDVSATSGKPRPEYTRMLADVEAGTIQAIIVWHVDRLYRVMSDLQALLPVVQGHRIPIRTVKAGDLDLSTSTGQMLAEILAAVAGQEGRAKAERWKRSWRQRRELGQVTPAGWRTFGYTIDGQILEDEAARLQTIAADVLAGKGLRTICTELNAEGVPTTRGGKWEGNALRKLLRNPRLAGYATYKGAVVGPGNWTPILERDTWHTLTALLDARSTQARPRRWLLSGLAHCGNCGHTLSARATRDYQSYKCVKAEGGCGAVDVRAERVEEVVELVARKHLSNNRIRRRLAEIRSGGQSHVLTELDTLQARLAEIDAQLADPGRSVAALIRASDAIRDRIDTLQATLTVTAPVAIPAGDEWPADLHKRRRLIEVAVADVLVDPATTRGGRFDPRRVRIIPAAG